MRYFSIIVACLGMFGGTACKTSSTSSQKALPLDQANLSLEDWVSACQRELDNPQTGAESRKELQALAQTSDCRSAYPTVRNIVEQYRAR